MKNYVSSKNLPNVLKKYSISMKESVFRNSKSHTFNEVVLDVYSSITHVQADLGLLQHLRRSAL